MRDESVIPTDSITDQWQPINKGTAPGCCLFMIINDTDIPVIVSIEKDPNYNYYISRRNSCYIEHKYMNKYIYQPDTRIFIRSTSKIDDDGGEVKLVCLYERKGELYEKF